MVGATRKFLAIGLVMLAALGGNAYAAPEDGFYYLICRGGGQLNPIIQPTDDATLIILNFRSSPNAWKNESSLGAGQCTWADRKLSDNEPRKIRFAIPADISVTKSWGPNVKAFFFPFQQPVNRTVSRTTQRAAIQVMGEAGGFSLKLLRPNSSRPSRRGSEPQGRAYEAMATFDFSENSYLTYSVQAIDGVFVANRLIKGAVTGEQITIDAGGEVIIAR